VKKKEGVSDTEKKIWEDYIKNPKDVFDKDLENIKESDHTNRYRFDLHGFTLLEANKKIKELIIYCQNKNFKEILLITGKGLHSNTDQNTYVSRELSKLKFAVPEYIKTQKDLLDKIISIDAAETYDGGEGAFIIKLKKL